MRTSTDTFDANPGPTTRLRRLIRRLWCRHRQVTATSKAAGRPARVVCTACGWHEPVLTAIPRDTRRNTPSADEARFLLAQRRRAALEDQRKLALSHLAPTTQLDSQTATTRRGRLLHMKPAAGE